MVLIPPLPGGGTASWWFLSRQALFPFSDHSTSSIHHRLLYLERVPFLVLLSGFLSVFGCFLLCRCENEVPLVELVEEKGQEGTRQGREGNIRDKLSKKYTWAVAVWR